MLFREWRSQVVDAATRIAGRGGDPEVRLKMAVAEIYRLMQARVNELSSYEELPEEELKAQGDLRARALLREAPPPWRPPPAGDAKALLRSLGVEARALDKALWELREKDRPQDPDAAYAVKVGGYEVLLIPRTQAPPRFTTPQDSQPFSRRGFLHHRVLPREIGGAVIDLVTARAMTDWRPDVLRVLAAIFDKLDLVWEPRAARGFVVTDVDCTDQAQQIEEQLAASRETDSCLALVWPELCLPLAMRDLILAELRKGLFARGGKPGLAVLGSWHEEVGDKTYNLARVHDGYGRELLTYRKMMKLHVGGRSEAIEIGSKLPVVILEDLLIAFGICKDFCDRARDPPYGLMNVDLVIVPSYGNRETMQTHCDTANDLRIRFGGRAFVVQQSGNEKAGVTRPSGYVAGLLDDPGAASPSELVQSGRAATYAARGGRRQPKTS